MARRRTTAALGALGCPIIRVTGVVVKPLVVRALDREQAGMSRATAEEIGRLECLQKQQRRRQHQSAAQPAAADARSVVARPWSSLP